LLEHRRSMKEELSEFFQEPSRDKFREIVRNLDAEYDFTDFKSKWPDLSKVAKHILGMANSGGGIIVIGIKENDDRLNAAGVNPKDRAEIDEIDAYLPGSPDEIYALETFKYDSSDYGDLEGKSFQVIFVNYNEERIPLVSENNGKEIKSGRIYYREGTKTEEASHQQIQDMISKRVKNEVDTPGQEFEEDISQLRSLYKNYPTGPTKHEVPNIMLGSLRLSGQVRSEDKEVWSDFKEFMDEMIEAKKDRIREKI
jgi:hypothetical protein